MFWLVCFDCGFVLTILAEAPSWPVQRPSSLLSGLDFSPTCTRLSHRSSSCLSHRFSRSKYWVGTSPRTWSRVEVVSFCRKLWAVTDAFLCKVETIFKLSPLSNFSSAAAVLQSPRDFHKTFQNKNTPFTASRQRKISCLCWQSCAGEGIPGCFRFYENWVNIGA